MKRREEREERREKRRGTFHPGFTSIVNIFDDSV
jgi:hypothetical protein